MEFNKLIPELKVSNFKKSFDFYTKVVGFKLEYERLDSKFAFISLHGSQIMLEEVNDDWKTGDLEYPFGRGTHLQMKVKSIKPILESLNKNKYKIFIKAHKKWYRKENQLLGTRQFLVKDPDGYLLRFIEDIGIKSL